MQGGQQLTAPCGPGELRLAFMYEPRSRGILLSYLLRRNKMENKTVETEKDPQMGELGDFMFIDSLREELEGEKGFKEKKKVISKWYKVVEELEEEVHMEQLERPSKEQREVWRLLAGLKGIEEGEAKELVVGNRVRLTERRSYALIMWTLAEVFGVKLEQFQPKDAPLFDKWIEGSGEGVWIVGSGKGGIRVVSGRVVVCSVGPWREGKKGGIGNWKGDGNRVSGFFQVMSFK